MWKLTIEDDDGQRTTLELAHEEYSIGRADNAAVRLTERNVSREHAIIRGGPSGWVIEDRDSYNGTYVNGERVSGQAAVPSGAVVHIADYRIELLEVAETAGAPAPSGDSRRRRPDRLVMVVGPTPGQEYSLEGERLSVGRAEEAQVSINHASVSRLHAEMVSLDDGRWEVLDQASSNGIRINGVDLPRGILEPGDALELGDVRLRFVAAGKYFRPSYDLSQQLPVVGFESMAPAGSVRSTADPARNIGRLVLAFAVVGVMVVALWFILRSPKDVSSSAAPETSAKVSSEEAGLLSQAQRIAKRDIELAHKMLQQIPEDSAVRDEEAFTEIEDQWADAKFEEVAKAKKKNDKLEILNLIIETTSVSAAKRKKAADLALEIEPDRPRRVIRPRAGKGARPSSAAPRDGGTKTEKSKAAPKPPPAADPSLVGNSAAARKKAALYGLVQSGAASLGQMYALKAACVQLQDMNCAQMAVNAIAKKKASKN